MAKTRIMAAGVNGAGMRGTPDLTVDRRWRCVGEMVCCNRTELSVLDHNVAERSAR